MKEIKRIVDLLIEMSGYDQNMWALVDARLPKGEKELLQTVRLSESEDPSVELQDDDQGNLSQKSGLKRKLFRELLQYDPPNHRTTPLERAFYNCQQQTAVMNILSSKGEMEVAKSIAERLISRSKKYHFTEVRIAANRLLSTYYSTYDHKIKRLDEVNSDLKLALEIQKNELQINLINNEINAKRSSSAYTDEEIADEYIDAYDDMSKLAESNIDSRSFYRDFYSIGTVIYSLKGDFNASLDASKKGLAHFTNLHYDYQPAKSEFVRSILDNQIALTELDDAIETIENSSDVLIPGSPSWFGVKRASIQINLENKNYLNAYNSFVEVTKSRKFDRIKETEADFYDSAEVYFSYLTQTDELDKEFLPTRHTINRFLRAIPAHDEEQRIRNSAILIGQLMQHVLDLNYDEINATVKSLKKYARTKLSLDNPFYRTNCFIHMALCIPDGNYHPIAIERRMERFLARLESVPFKINTDPLIAELVPYEQRWKEIIDRIKPPKRRRKKA